MSVPRARCLPRLWANQMQPPSKPGDWAEPRRSLILSWPNMPNLQEERILDLLCCGFDSLPTLSRSDQQLSGRPPARAP
jgi:hypothetical protein